MHFYGSRGPDLLQDFRGASGGRFRRSYFLAGCCGLSDVCLRPIRAAGGLLIMVAADLDRLQPASSSRPQNRCPGCYPTGSLQPAGSSKPLNRCPGCYPANSSQPAPAGLQTGVLGATPQAPASSSQLQPPNLCPGCTCKFETCVLVHKCATGVVSWVLAHTRPLVSWVLARRLSPHTCTGRCPGCVFNSCNGIQLS